MNDPDKIRLYVGTYNHPEPHAPVACGPGIVTCSLDLRTGRIEQRHVFPDVINSSYLAADPTRRWLFSTSETMGAGNAVHMFRIQPDGSLKHLGTQPTKGIATCHISVLPGDRVCAPSYMESCIDVFPYSEAGLGSEVYHSGYQGSGPNAARQEASHAHQVAVSPDGRWVYVVDLGSDCVWRHDAALALAPLPSPMPAGHGARHMVFHTSLPRAYVLGEMTGAIAVCDCDQESGGLKPATTTEVLGDDASAAAIRCHPSGKALWISLRSSRSLRVFPLDGQGNPSAAREISLGDGEPRDFTISPDGRWLVSANQSANHLAVLELDPATGLPADGQITRFDLGTPCSVLFVPA